MSFTHPKPNSIGKPVKSMLRGQPLYHLVNTLFLVLGLAFFITGSFPYYRAAQAADWPFVMGRIEVSEMRATDPARGATLSHKVKLEYTYRVDDVDYHGRRVEFGVGSKAFLLEEFAERLVQRYPVGKMVRVYYNPTNHGKSVLERSPSLGSGMIWILFAVVFLTVSFMIPFKDPLERLRSR